MSVIIRLQNLPWSANARDIRDFFKGESIPEGGVHIVGGEQGDAFIAFSTDEDARLAMRKTGNLLKGIQVTLLLSSRAEMQQVIEQARQTALAMHNFMAPPSTGMGNQGGGGSNYGSPSIGQGQQQQQQQPQQLPPQQQQLPPQQQQMSSHQQPMHHQQHQPYQQQHPPPAMSNYASPQPPVHTPPQTPPQLLSNSGPSHMGMNNVRSSSQEPHGLLGPHGLSGTHGLSGRPGLSGSGTPELLGPPGRLGHVIPEHHILPEPSGTPGPPVIPGPPILSGRPALPVTSVPPIPPTQHGNSVHVNSSSITKKDDKKPSSTSMSSSSKRDSKSYESGSSRRRRSKSRTRSRSRSRDRDRRRRHRSRSRSRSRDRSSRSRRRSRSRDRDRTSRDLDRTRDRDRDRDSGRDIGRDSGRDRDRDNKNRNSTGRDRSERNSIDAGPNASMSNNSVPGINDVINDMFPSSAGDSTLPGLGDIPNPSLRGPLPPLPDYSNDGPIKTPDVPPIPPASTQGYVRGDQSGYSDMNYMNSGGMPPRDDYARGPHGGMGQNKIPYEDEPRVMDNQYLGMDNRPMELDNSSKMDMELEGNSMGMDDNYMGMDNQMGFDRRPPHGFDKRPMDRSMDAHGMGHDKLLMGEEDPHQQFPNQEKGLLGDLALEKSQYSEDFDSYNMSHSGSYPKAGEKREMYGGSERKRTRWGDDKQETFGTQEVNPDDPWNQKSEFEQGNDSQDPNWNENDWNDPNGKENQGLEEPKGGYDDYEESGYGPSGQYQEEESYDDGSEYYAGRGGFRGRGGHGWERSQARGRGGYGSPREYPEEYHEEAYEEDNSYHIGRGGFRGRGVGRGRGGERGGHDGFGDRSALGGFEETPSLDSGFGDRGGREGFGDYGSRGGYAERGSRGGYAERGSRGGFAERGSRGGFGERGSRGGFAERGGRGGFAERGGRGGFAERGGREGFTEHGREEFTEHSGREGFAELSGREGFAEHGREGFSEHGDQGGFAERGGRGGFAERGGRGGFAERGGRGGFAERGGRGGFAERGGRGGFTESSGRGGFAESSGRGGFAESSGRGGFAESSGRGGFAESSGRGGFAESSGRGGFAESSGRGGFTERGGRGGYAEHGGREGFTEHGVRGRFAERGGHGGISERNPVGALLDDPSSFSANERNDNNRGFDRRERDNAFERVDTESSGFGMEEIDEFSERGRGLLGVRGPRGGLLERESDRFSPLPDRAGRGVDRGRAGRFSPLTDRGGHVGDRGRGGFGERGGDRGRGGFGERGGDRGRGGFGERGGDRGRGGFGERGGDRGRGGFGERGGRSGFSEGEGRYGMRDSSEEIGGVDERMSRGEGSVRGGHGERDMGSSRGAPRGGHLGLGRESENDWSKPKITCSVEISPLPRNRSYYKQVRDLFHGIYIPHESIKFLADEQGNRTGVALLKFSTPRDAINATKRSGEYVMDARVNVILIDDEFYDSQSDKRNYTPDVSASYNAPETRNEPPIAANINAPETRTELAGSTKGNVPEKINEPTGGSKVNVPEKINEPVGIAKSKIPDKIKEPTNGTSSIAKETVKTPARGANNVAPEKEKIPPKAAAPKAAEAEFSPCLYVSGLPLGCGEHDVAEVFNNYIILDIVLDLVRGRRVPNGGCFIRLTSSEEAKKAHKDLMGKATLDMKPLTIKPCPLPAMEQAVQERDAVLKSTRIPPFRPQDGKPEGIKSSDGKDNVQTKPKIQSTTPKIQSTNPKIQSTTPKDPKLGNQIDKAKDIKQDKEKPKSQDIKPKDLEKKGPNENQNSKKPEPTKPEKSMPFGGDLLTDSVIIKGMPKHTNEANIRDFFSDEGLVPEKIYICPIANGAKDAYVMFPHIKDTKLAVSKSNQQICKKQVIVDFIPKPTVMKAMKLPFNPLELMKKGQEMTNKDDKVPKQKPNEKLINAIEKPSLNKGPTENPVKVLPQKTEPTVKSLPQKTEPPKPVEDKTEPTNKRPNTPIGELESRAYNQGPDSVHPFRPSGPRMEARPLMETGRGGPRPLRPRSELSGPRGPRGFDSPQGSRGFDSPQGSRGFDRPHQRESPYNRFDSPHQRDNSPFPQEHLDQEEPLGTPMPPENFGRPGCVVGIGNVPYKATTEDIIDFFRIVRILRPENVIRRYNEMNQPTSDARVSLTSPEEAIRAVRMLNGRYMLARPIYLNIVKE